MTDKNLASVLDALSEIGYQFGPFFFAILFTLVITRSARKWYSAASPDDRVAYRTYFNASWIFSMLLVATSVGWWIYAQLQGPHAFAGAIVALDPNEELASVSDDQYFWSRLWTHQGASFDKEKDYWFVFVSNHPVYRGEVFRFNYWDLVQPGAIGQAPPGPSAVIQVRVVDPTAFPQKYSLVRAGKGSVEAVPFK